MSDRNLAHIELITDIQPISGADNIVIATVLGWKCVVKKSEFKIGDKIIYCEIDSVMPDRPEYEFLRSRHFRIKTIKLKGQISQGLILPIESIPFQQQYMYDIGEDMTNILGIYKHLSLSEKEELNKSKIEKNKLKKFMYKYSWYRKLFLSRHQKEGFPYWVSKTDETRIQNIPHVLNDFKDEIVYITEKVDYQSVTFTGKLLPNMALIIGNYLPKKFKFIVCSRNFINNHKESLYWKIARKYNIEQILKENPTLTIQGEQGDSNIQGNKYGISEPKLWIFNIFDHEKRFHYSYHQMLDFCMKYKLTTVPYIGFFKIKDIASTIDEIINYSKGKSIINPKVEREGIVIRYINNGKKVLSFKVINPNFLLKYNE